MSKLGDFIFHIEERDLFGNGMSVVVYINTKKCWQKNQCLTNHYTTAERKCLSPVISKLGLDELMESTFEVLNKETKINDIKNSLITEGLEFNTEFSDWMLTN